MKLHEEFKLYENMWGSKTKQESKPKQPKRPLAEARSVADIEADIARLQTELADAKAAEKKASYNGNIPTEVWYWDVYSDPSKKGAWTSIEYDTVFETKDAAIDGAYVHLRELDDEGELEGEVDDYYVDAVKIPISKVSADALEWSGLDHLIESNKLTEAAGSNIKTFGRKSYDLSNEDELEAWVKANAEFQMKRYPGRYHGNFDTWWDSFSQFDLKRTILNNLITKLVSEGTEKAIIDKLVAMRDENQKAFDKDKRAINSVRHEAYTKDIIAAVKAGIDTFHKSLNPKTKERLGHRVIAAFEETEQQIIDLVLDLAFGVDIVGG